MIAGMHTARLTTLPWFFLVVAGLAALLGSGDLSARETGNRIFIWLVSAAVVCAIQGLRAPAHSQTPTG
jgi:hypothetical protein